MTTEQKKKLDFDTKIVTPVFRVSYPNVFVAKHNKLAKRDEFNIQMLFDKKTAATDLKAMRDLAMRVATATWGTKLPKIKNPFEDGDTAVGEDGELKKFKAPSIEGMFVLKAWTKNMPGLIDANKQPILEEDEFYGGCFARAQVNCYAWEYAGKFGISFGLLHVQKIKDGTPFGNRTKAEDAFTPVADESLAEETMGNNDSMFG